MTGSNGHGLGVWGMLLLWAGVAQVGLISSRYRARLPEWAVALAVFGGILCTVLGLALLLF
ncbi:hypothetical protein [Rhodospirillum sp. A1_3_36]|uniref:hypothetical protein n=1 Tax=Rhodospirillum sp. A1_3_36 TaxID=3391666 RepID=UPI0039A63C66